MELVDITNSNNAKKRLTAIFKDGERIIRIHFGQRGASTYIDNKDKVKRQNYIARHQVNEDWNNPLKAGTLARYILWGDNTSFLQNVKDYKKRFNL